MARSRKTTSSRPKFPYRPSDDKAVENAAQVLRSRYYDDVDSMAREILKEAAGSYETYEDAEEWIGQQVHESVDGSSMVLYTNQAINTVVQSDNWTEIDDMGGDLPDDMSKIMTAAAYYALRADVEANIEALKDEYFTDEDEDD